MHPNGQLPAYEFAFGDVNPPVHAWACWRVYKMTGPRGRARPALPRPRLPEAAAQLHLVGQPQGRRRASTSSPAASSGSTTSASSTARSRCPTAAASSRPTARRGWPSTAPRCSRWRWSWRSDDPAYEDIASKFFEHFVAIADAMNTLGGTGLWDEEDGFYYDQLHVDGRADAACASARWSGLIPLFAVEVLDDDVHRPAARLPQADAVVPGEPPRPGRGTSPTWSRSDRRRTAAGCWPFPSRAAARARPALPARRERVPLALRHPLAVARPPGPALTCSRRTAQQHRVDYEPGESDTRPVRRQLQLARAGLVPGQLPADRGAGALPPLLRRHAPGRVPDRLGPADEPPARWPRELAARLARLFPARRARPPPLPRRRPRASPTTRTGATSSSSTSTSTATPARGSAPATRPAGPRWSPSCSRTPSRRTAAANPSRDRDGAAGCSSGGTFCRDSPSGVLEYDSQTSFSFVACRG